MKFNRYRNLEKFITDPDKLVLNNGEEVIMSGYGDYCITFDMEDSVRDLAMHLNIPEIEELVCSWGKIKTEKTI